MTVREAAIISVCFDVRLCSINDILSYMSEICKRPVYSHELSELIDTNIVRTIAFNDLWSATHISNEKQRI